jgi:hypothetical protein
MVPNFLESQKTNCFLSERDEDDVDVAVVRIRKG